MPPIKGTLTRDFWPLFFSSNNFPLAPGTRVKAFSNMASNSRGLSTKLVAQQCQRHTLFRISLRIIRHTVFIRKSDSAAHGTAVSLTPLCANITLLWLWTSYWRGSGYLEREYLLKNIHRQIVLHTKIWGLTSDRFLSRCDENRRFSSKRL
jgi:hypothetical protein